LIKGILDFSREKGKRPLTIDVADGLNCLLDISTQKHPFHHKPSVLMTDLSEQW
jgi:hypothetical protein